MARFDENLFQEDVRKRQAEASAEIVAQLHSDVDFPEIYDSSKEVWRRRDNDLQVIVRPVGKKITKDISDCYNGESNVKWFAANQGLYKPGFAFSFESKRVGDFVSGRRRITIRFYSLVA